MSAPLSERSSATAHRCRLALSYARAPTCGRARRGSWTTCRLPFATSASIVLRFGMLMRTPPDKLPEQPPRGSRNADAYLLAFVIASIVVAALIGAYALPLRW